MTSVYVPHRNEDGSLPVKPSYGEFPFDAVRPDLRTDHGDAFLEDCINPDGGDEGVCSLQRMNSTHRSIIGTGIKLACATGNLFAVQAYAADFEGVARATSAYGHQVTSEEKDSIKRFLTSVVEDGLQLAARNGHDNVVKYLLSDFVRDTLGTNIHANSNGAFHEACEQERVSTAKILIKAGILSSREEIQGLELQRLLNLIEEK